MTISNEEKEQIWQALQKIPIRERSNILYFLCGYCHHNKQFWDGLKRMVECFAVKEKC